MNFPHFSVVIASSMGWRKTPPGEKNTYRWKNISTPGQKGTGEVQYAISYFCPYGLSCSFTFSLILNHYWSLVVFSLGGIFSRRYFLWWCCLWVVFAPVGVLDIKPLVPSCSFLPFCLLTRFTRKRYEC